MRRNNILVGRAGGDQSSESHRTLRARAKRFILRAASSIRRPGTWKKKKNEKKLYAKKFKSKTLAALQLRSFHLHARYYYTRARNRGFQPMARRCTTGYRVKIFRPTRRAHTAVTFCKKYIHRFSIPCIPYANNNLETSHSPSSRIHALAHHHTNEWTAPRNNDLVVPVKIIPIDRFIKTRFRPREFPKRKPIIVARETVRFTRLITIHSTTTWHRARCFA